MLLVDVDAVSKLIQWRLLEELPALVGQVFSEMATVPSLIYRAQREMKTPGKLFGTAEAATVAATFLQKFAPLTAPPNELLAPFADVAGIDPGEAVLIAHLLHDPNAILLTGDKRALRALAQLDRQLVGRLCSRIIVIEQVIEGALAANDLEWLRERVCPRRHIDIAVGNIMGSQCDASRAEVEEGLASYINELRRLHNPDMLCASLNIRR